MKFFIYFTGSDSSGMPSPEGMAEMGRMMGEAFEAGMIVATGQMPQSTTHVQVEGDETVVTEGPFFESKEMIPGFTIIEVDTKQEAIDWAAELRRCMGDGRIRIAALSATGPEDIQ